MEVSNGADYEYHCASRLRAIGWEIKGTGRSGDHGCDIIATLGGIRVAIQCKFSGKPVGNRAVQEIYAAKAHYRGSFAAVITNAGYTPAAETLARSTSVKLLRTKDLEVLDQLVGARCQAPKPASYTYYHSATLRPEPRHKLEPAPPLHLNPPMGCFERTWRRISGIRKRYPPAKILYDNPAGCSDRGYQFRSSEMVARLPPDSEVTTASAESSVMVSSNKVVEPLVRLSERELWACRRCPTILRLPAGKAGFVTCPSCQHRSFYST